jgi:hypothetical protein
VSQGTPIDLAKLRSIGHLRGGRTRAHIADGRRPEHDPGVDAGQRCKATTDELGNTVVESANRQDVRIRAPHVRAHLAQSEVRSE